MSNSQSDPRVVTCGDVRKQIREGSYALAQDDDAIQGHIHSCAQCRLMCETIDQLDESLTSVMRCEAAEYELSSGSAIALGVDSKLNHTGNLAPNDSVVVRLVSACILVLAVIQLSPLISFAHLPVISTGTWIGSIFSSLRLNLKDMGSFAASIPSQLNGGLQVSHMFPVFNSTYLAGALVTSAAMALAARALVRERVTI